jgi:pimeloyl-ACP methyl ester carboxylesterase
MPFTLDRFTDGDVTMGYEIHGTGPRTLVYMHGLLLDTHVNRRLARDLAASGNRVVLLDLPGHGVSDKPRRAAAHRMDAYAGHVLALMDHLGVEKAAVGGISLGADVTLQVALRAPERLVAMVLEMPVLESATPFAASVFVPLLTATHYATPVVRAVSRLARRVPRRWLGPLDQFWGALLLEPEELVSVLHGVLVGPVAPTADQRAAMTMPTLVLGHRADWLHPLADAAKLVSQLPNAELLQAHSLFELRLTPDRLTERIAAFLDQVWAGETDAGRAARAG